MIILAFDSCFQACSVAVGQASAGRYQALPPSPTPSAHHFETRQKGHAEVLVPLIEQVLAAANITPGEVDQIAVTHGPGSFTGTRTNVAAARGLALALGVPVMATTSLRVMGMSAYRRLSEERGSKLQHPNVPIAVTVDARRDAVYALLCSPDGIGLDSGVAVMSVEEAARLGCEADDTSGGGILFVGTGAEAVCACAQASGRQAAAALQDLQPDALDLWRMAVLGDLVHADPVNPLYLRPADAKPQVGKTVART